VVQYVEIQSDEDDGMAVVEKVGDNVRTEC
jgi:hypothetical protein